MADKIFCVKIGDKQVEVTGEKLEAYWLDLGEGQQVSVIKNGDHWQTLTRRSKKYQVIEVKSNGDFFTGNLIVDTSVVTQLIKSKQLDPIDLIPIYKVSSYHKKVCDIAFKDLLKQDYDILIENLDERYKRFSLLVLYFAGPYLKQDMPVNYKERFNIWTEIKKTDKLNLSYITFFILNDIRPKIRLIFKAYIDTDDKKKNIIYIVNWYQEVISPIDNRVFNELIIYYRKYTDTLKKRKRAVKYYKKLLRWGIEQNPSLYPKAHIVYTYLVMNYNNPRDVNYLTKLTLTNKPLIPNKYLILELACEKKWEVLDFIAKLDKSVVRKVLLKQIDQEEKNLRNPLYGNKNLIKENILKLEEELANPDTILLPTFEEMSRQCYFSHNAPRYKKYLESRGYRT